MSEDEQNHQYCWNPNANTFGNSFLNLSARAVNSIGSFFTVKPKNLSLRNDSTRNTNYVLRQQISKSRA